MQQCQTQKKDCIYYSLWFVTSRSRCRTYTSHQSCMCHQISPRFAHKWDYYSGFELKSGKEIFSCKLYIDNYIIIHLFSLLSENRLCTICFDTICISLEEICFKIFKVISAASLLVEEHDHWRRDWPIVIFIYISWQISHIRSKFSKLVSTLYLPHRQSESSELLYIK